jgi:transcriptional regulator of acetoin/glycerol metabolism
MPPAERTHTRVGEPDVAESEGSTALGFQETMRLAHDRAARVYLVALLQKVGGDVSHAARLAGVKRESLHRLLRKHGVSAAAFRSDGGEEKD